MLPSFATLNGNFSPLSNTSSPPRTARVRLGRTFTMVPTTAATSPPSSTCSIGMPVYAGKCRSMASVFTAGNSVMVSL